ncbi:MAG: hypothetical protein IJT51_10190 [Bacteroidales bacterium]|nr:hypothetical protein [Bacteroidales bacterium]
MGQLSIKDFFWLDVQKIKSACKQADIIHGDAKNIRSAGDEVEITLRNFFKEKLAPKYDVTTGHVVDHNLKMSPQLDIIIADSIKSPVLVTLTDKTQHVFYETVYAIGEVKKSWYDDSLLEKFSSTIKTIKTELERDDIGKDILECGDNQLKIKGEVTSNPRRNMLFSFMLFAEGSANFKKITSTINATPNEFLPNAIFFIGGGVIVNVNKAMLTQNEVEINLYPELVSKDDGEWIFIGLDEENQRLTYLYLLLLEHLKQTIVATPDIQSYTKKLISFEPLDIRKL